MLSKRQPYYGSTRIIRVTLFDRFVAMFGGALAGIPMSIVCIAFGMQGTYWWILFSLLCVVGAVAGLFAQFFYLAYQRSTRRDFIRRDKVENLFQAATQEISSHYATMPNSVEANAVVKEVQEKLNELLNGY